MLSDKIGRSLKNLCLNLAKQIVVDGEGSKKFVTINVINAKSLGSAKNIAFAIANSPLVKTAVAGEDPNWGRIIMAIGKSKVSVNLNKLNINEELFNLLLPDTEAVEEEAAEEEAVEEVAEEAAEDAEEEADEEDAEEDAEEEE